MILMMILMMIFRNIDVKIAFSGKNYESVI